MTRPILIDVDGVCIDWLTPFLAYVGKPGTIVTEHDLRKSIPGIDLGREITGFHHTSAYYHLDLMKGVVEGVFALRERFPKSLLLAVTACGQDELTMKARNYQLRHLPLDSVIAVPIAGSKASVYAQFTPGWVIDDHADHLVDAGGVGHRTILYDQAYNREEKGFQRAKSWADVVEIIT